MAENSQPNPKIDKAIDLMMDEIQPKKKGDPLPVPHDTAVKIINMAISWEKAKAQISDKQDGFDPDGI